jgi:hypothetical protein
MANKISNFCPGLTRGPASAYDPRQRAACRRPAAPAVMEPVAFAAPPPLPVLGPGAALRPSLSRWRQFAPPGNALPTAAAARLVPRATATAPRACKGAEPTSARATARQVDVYDTSLRDGAQGVFAGVV